MEPRLLAGMSHSPASTRSQSPGVPNGAHHDGVEDSADAAPAPSSTFQEYPPAQPFVNDDYRRDASKPLTAYPESNRQAVMSALRGLQEKIRSLESERTIAEKNLRTLATETSRYHDIMQSEPEKSWLSQASGASPQPANMTLQAQDIHGKLEVAEHRCDMLEKQLGYMRRMVQSAENERNAATRRAALLEQDRQDSERETYMNKLNKIAKLEREHLKLTATQAIAENRIRELEEKLRQERAHRQNSQHRAAERETAAQTKRILMEANSRTQKPKKNKKKKAPADGNGCHVQASAGNKKYPDRMKPGREPPEACKVNVAEIPFVAGKSTGPSHSLPANFQEVLSLMKSRNPKLCQSSRSHLLSGYKHLNSHASSGSRPGLDSGGSRPKSGGSRPKSTSSPEMDLTELLLQLQDEFGQLSFEHQELSRQLQEAVDLGLTQDLERELDHVVARMEAKGQQISRLRRHQEQLQTAQGRPKKKSHTVDASHLRSAMTGVRAPLNGEVEVTTTIRTKGKSAGSLLLSPTSTNKAQASLNLFKDLKKIQTSLRKDDITWE